MSLALPLVSEPDETRTDVEEVPLFLAICLTVVMYIQVLGISLT